MAYDTEMGDFDGSFSHVTLGQLFDNADWWQVSICSNYYIRFF